MRVPNVAPFLICACLLSVDLASGQPPKAAPAKPMLAARMEVDEHEHCFTVRFFLKNETDLDVDVTFGRGDSGLEVVPAFHVGSGSESYITPPTYLGPSKRSLRPNVMKIPAAKEILYGTFTMGYPYREKENVEEIYATIQFRELRQFLKTEPVRLKIPSQKSGATGVIVKVDNNREGSDPHGEWVHSDNGDLSLRLRVKSARLATQGSMVVIADIRNNRQVPVTILRPFGDPYSAKAVQIKIWNSQIQEKYSGPKLDFDLNAKAIVTLGANEIVSDTLELPVHDFAGTDKAGTYTLRFDYAYSGAWDKKAASEGVKEIWHGAMCSREIQLQKK